MQHRLYSCESCRSYTKQKCLLNQKGYPLIGSACVAFDYDPTQEELNKRVHHEQSKAN